MARFYASAYEIFSEVLRDIHEMGIEVRPKSYQDKIIQGQDEFITKEMQFYYYILTSLPDPQNLFLFEGDKARIWAEAEFQERVNPQARNPGEAWKIRKEVWEEFLTSEGKFHYTYSERINPHLIYIMDELYCNPDTRQAWLPIFHPSDVFGMGGKKRIPCSLGYYFMVRKGVLDLTYIQRSGDVVKHWGNDIYLAWRMMEYVANKMNLVPGYLHHITFSLHSYKRDWAKISEGISNLKPL